MSSNQQVVRVDGEPIIRYNFGFLTIQINNDHEFPVTMGTAALTIITREQARSIARVLLSALDGPEGKRE